MSFSINDTNISMVLYLVFCYLSMVAGLCHFVFSPRNKATRNNEKTPREKTKHAKRQNNAMGKDEITKPATRKVEIPTQKDEKTLRKKRNLKLSICRLFAWVFSSFRVALFRLFAWRLFAFSHGVFSRSVFSLGVLSSFRVALFCPFAGVLSRVVISSFRMASFRLASFRMASFSSFRVASFHGTLFRLFTWRHFVFSRGVFSSFRMALFRLFVISSFRLYCLLDITA